MLDLVLAAPEHHTNAEERRLMYVALTRARESVQLLVESSDVSSFVGELVSYVDVGTFGDVPDDTFSCPRCVEGHLSRKKGSKGNFWGCSNWPYCDHTMSPCPRCSSGLPVSGTKDGFLTCTKCGGNVDACPRCQRGWLGIRSGKHGRFLGCSEYPRCDYTRNAS